MERLEWLCLAVGRGSPHPPRFVSWQGKVRCARGTSRALVLIGKGARHGRRGVGGPRYEQDEVRHERIGRGWGFASLATSSCRSAWGPDPSAENAIGGRAVKPGDGVRAMDGTTIEITNTDAEGRLLLADALVYARRFTPDAVVDLATLTGAMSIALGRHAAGLYTRDDALAAELLAAGGHRKRLWLCRSGPVLKRDARRHRDLVNSNERREAARTPRPFLSHCQGPAWAHLDIAAPHGPTTTA
jgi:leucyl aminopeptidase